MSPISLKNRNFLKTYKKQKKAPIWDLFFAAQFLWPQHFLHGITENPLFWQLIFKDIIFVYKLYWSKKTITIFFTVKLSFGNLSLWCFILNNPIIRLLHEDKNSFRLLIVLCLINRYEECMSKLLKIVIQILYIFTP